MKTILKSLACFFLATAMSLYPVFGQGSGTQLHIDALVSFDYPQVDSLMQDNDHDTSLMSLLLVNTRLGVDANILFLPLGDSIQAGALLGVRGTYAPALKLTSSTENNVMLLDMPVGFTTLHEFSSFNLQPFLGVNNRLLMGDVSAYDLGIVGGTKLLLSSWIVALDLQWNFLLDDATKVQLIEGQYLIELGVGYRFSMM